MAIFTGKGHTAQFECLFIDSNHRIWVNCLLSLASSIRSDGRTLYAITQRWPSIIYSGMQQHRKNSCIEPDKNCLSKTWRCFAVCDAWLNSMQHCLHERLIELYTKNNKNNVLNLRKLPCNRDFILNGNVCVWCFSFFLSFFLSLNEWVVHASQLFFTWHFSLLHCMGRSLFALV